MKRQTLHEIAKFASGLILGDFLAVAWLASNGAFPFDFLGMQFTSDVVLPTMLFDLGLFVLLIHYGWYIGKTPLLRERTYLLAAGIVFGIVSLAHLVRVFTGADFDILGWAVPLWLSWIGMLVSGYLSYMSFHLALSAKRR